MRSWSLPVAGILLACLPFIGRGSVYSTAPDTTTALEKPVYDKAFFRDRLGRLAQKYHVGFVVEGEPHVVVLSHLKAFPEIPNESREEAVQRLAEAFDYSVKPGGSLYLLRKKYTYPQEIPGVTPGECRQAAMSLRVLLNSLGDPKANEDIYISRNAIETIRSGATSSQLDRLNHGGLIRISEFTPEQREAATRLMMHVYVEEMAGKAAFVESEFDEKRNVRFARDTSEKLPSKVGYLADFEQGAQKYASFRPIIRPRFSKTDASGTVVRESGMQLPVLDEPSITVSILEMVNRQNARLKETSGEEKDRKKPIPGAGAVTFGVDEVLGQKPVTLIGENVAPPEDIVAGVAEVYGLRVRHVPETEERVITRIPVRMESLADSMAAVRRCLPLPLATALHLMEGNTALPSVPVTRQGRNAHSPPPDFGARSAARMALTECLSEASWQLADSVESELDKREKAGTSPNGTNTKSAEIPLRESTLFLQSRLSVVVMQELLQRVFSRQDPPSYVTRFEELSMSFQRGVGPDGVKTITIGFFIPHPQTGALIPALLFPGKDTDGDAPPK